MSKLSELRWQCRRGKLELDVLLSNFLEREGPTLSEVDLAALEELLGLSDEELLDLMLGKAAPAVGDQARLVAAITACGRT